MKHNQLLITIIQPDIFWEDKIANLEQYDGYFSNLTGKQEVIALPEMFNTGFSMAPERLAEPMNGNTVQWMLNRSKKYKCILTGSLIIVEEGKYYNRMLWVTPDGKIGYYNKRHLFGLAEENVIYTAGNIKQFASVNGWVINLQICYDLRFPVWGRNEPNMQYDVLLYVANWPQQRSLAWRTLLQARAIENQCFVVGVNRVGKDLNHNEYVGESSVFGPLGELMWQGANEETCYTVTLDKTMLDNTRNNFPFLKDGDKFLLF